MLDTSRCATCGGKIDWSDWTKVTTDMEGYWHHRDCLTTYLQHPIEDLKEEHEPGT